MFGVNHNGWYGKKGLRPYLEIPSQQFLEITRIVGNRFKRLKVYLDFLYHRGRDCMRVVLYYAARRFARLSGIAAVQGLDDQSSAQVDGERRPWVAMGKSAIPCRSKDPESLILCEA